jgi:hypothetical protein
MMWNRFIPFATLLATAALTQAPSVWATSEISPFGGHAIDNAKATCFSEAWGGVKNTGTDTNCNTNGYTGNSWGPAWEIPLPASVGTTIHPVIQLLSTANGVWPTCCVTGNDNLGICRVGKVT